MGKASKKVKRQVQKKVEKLRIQQCQPKEEVLLAAFEAGEYTQVLEMLAELIEAKDIKPELLYKGAYSYFMIGDYDRAAQWVNNTLNYDQNNVEARILLARLCIIQDRHDDGWAIYDFLVRCFLNNMTSEQKEQIRDGADYYVRQDKEKIQQCYPNLAEFLQLQDNITSIEKTSAEATAVEAEKNTLSALQRLKEKLQTVQRKNEQDAVDNSKNSTQGGVSESCEDINVSKKIAEIQSQTCSLREKVKLLNKFAAAGFVAEEYWEAEAYLKAALQLDDGDSQTIRNMAIIQASIGEIDRAEALVAKLPEIDFMLLYMLEQKKKR